jgi:hypothetical protein
MNSERAIFFFPRSVTALFGLMMLCLFCVPFLCSAEQNIFTEEMPLEGHWGHEISADCGINFHSVSIQRRDNVFEGGVGVGCGGGRIWFSILKGEKKGNKLFARICLEPDDEKDNEKFNKCMEGSPTDYFVRRGKSLVWFVKENGEWKEYLVLQRARLAKKAPKK